MREGRAHPTLPRMQVIDEELSISHALQLKQADHPEVRGNHPTL